jgi:cell division protein FtsB
VNGAGWNFKVLSWKWVSLGLGAMLLWLQAALWIGQGSIAEIVALQRKLDAQLKSNAELAERNSRLDVEVAEFRDKLDSVDEMAREELGMVKDDETYYVVIER